jgi:superoxide reductase
MVEMVHVGGGTLVCCGQPMTLLNENTEDAATEKHVPVIEQDGDEVTVSVGSVLHPMEEKHFIQWIEVITTDKVYRRHLKPGDKPVAQFIIEGEVVKAREYCNLHGLWSA